MSETKPAQHSVTFLKTDLAGNVNPNTPLRTFLARDGISSNQSMGVWIVDGVAWKIFQERGTKGKLDDAIRRANLAGLPLPGHFRTEFGTIHKLGEPRPYSGFALVGSAVTGTAFSQKKNAVFQQTINTIADDAILERIERACDAAVEICLMDIQGKLNAGDAQHPIVFLDINLGTANVQAQALRQIVRDRRTALLPQHGVRPGALSPAALRALLLGVAPISLLTPDVRVPGIPDVPTHAALDPDTLTLDDPLVQLGLVTFFRGLAANDFMRAAMSEAVRVGAGGVV